MFYFQSVKNVISIEYFKTLLLINCRSNLYNSFMLYFSYTKLYINHIK